MFIAYSQAPEGEGTSISIPTEQTGPKEGAETQESESKNSSSQFQEAPPVEAGIEKQDNPVSPDPRTDDPNYYNREDLKAQRHMADATDELVRITKIEIGLLVAGSLGLLATIIYTHLTLTLTNNTVRHQLRAYFLVDDVTVMEVDAGRNVEVIFRNSGQTPAKSIKGFVGFVLGEADERHFDIEDALLKETRDIGPNQNLKMIKNIAEARMSYRDFQDVEAGGTPFFVHGRLTYKDVFAAPHSTVFRFKYHRRDKRLYVADKGNEAD